MSFGVLAQAIEIVDAIVQHPGATQYVGRSTLEETVYHVLMDQQMKVHRAVYEMCALLEPLRRVGEETPMDALRRLVSSAKAHRCELEKEET